MSSAKRQKTVDRSDFVGLLERSESIGVLNWLMGKVLGVGYWLLVASC